MISETIAGGIDHRPVQMMTPEAVAQLLTLSESTLAKWRMHPGKGPAFVRVSPRRVLYPVAAVNEFLAERTRRSTLEGRPCPEGTDRRGCGD